MILTGPVLEETAYDVWGRDWPSKLARYLAVARKTVYRWRDDGPPASARPAIEAAIEEQLLIVAKRLDMLREGPIES